MVLNISGIRTAAVGEILPTTIEHSATISDEVATYALDMNLETRSSTGEDSNGNVWIKMTLDEVYCLQQVIWFSETGSPKFTWTCLEEDCSDCVGFCSSFSLTVSIEGAESELPPISDCRYGDNVVIQKVADSADGFMVNEMAIIKKGNFNGCNRTFLFLSVQSFLFVVTYDAKTVR